jgi:hypothetical protein
MQENLITKIEDKYVFTISTIVWRVFIAVAALGMAVGIALFLWGVIPAFKSSPDKEKYPTVTSVSLDELNGRLLPQQQQQSRPVMPPERPTRYTEQTEKEAEQMMKFGEYGGALDTLRALMPESHYTWQSQGRWNFPYGVQSWNYYHDARYRQWIVTVYGIPDRIDRACKEAGITTDPDRNQFLLMCAKFVRGYPMEKRGQALDAALKAAQINISKSISNLNLLVVLRDHIFKERSNILLSFADILSRNPSDGASLLEYALTAVDSFDVTVRDNVVIAMVTDYSQRFNNRLDREKEFTDLFLGMAKSFDSKLQLPALEKYYDLAIAKNAERERVIRRIDARHETALAQAELEYQAATAKKSEWRLLGLYGVGAGVATIAFIALLLVLLSIQRYVRKIAESQELSTATTPISQIESGRRSRQPTRR